MYSELRSAAVNGIDAFTVEIETHLDNSIPGFLVVGLPDSAVKESRERVTAAIKNSGFSFPLKKITVNLAPADVRKEGSTFDLPIALGVLSSAGAISPENLSGIMACGELSLDGSLRPIQGCLPIAVEAKRKKIDKLIVPAENAEEAALAGGPEVIPAENLFDAVGFLNGEITIEAAKVDISAIFSRKEDMALPDLSDVKGQESVKRAIEVAAAGGHNLLMIGPPGSGKTMLAKRIPGILPDLSVNESIETTKIHSVAGMLPPGRSLITTRPFRSPHHTISNAALVGGGMSKIRPGEISLSHHGVLFLDELPEFARNVLEVLRQPLEEKNITISRTRMTVDYPANFMMVCSMNPCPCGNFGNPAQECTCTPTAIQRYVGKISGPLLDRIDIHVEVPVVKYSELSSKKSGESSSAVRDRVFRARQLQNKRFMNDPNSYKNADMSSKQIRSYCTTDEASQQLMKMAMTKLGLSARAYDRILKVSRTIADLEAAENISAQHISEAIQYRSLDRDYWN